MTASAQKPLRILLMNSARRWIGEAAHTLALAEALRGRDHSVWLGARAGFELEARARERGVPIIPLAFNSRFHPLADLRDCLRVRDLIRRERIDLVHCHRGKDHWLGAIANLLLKNPPPLVRTRHVVTPARGHLLNRWLYGSATQGLISVSQAARDSLGPLARRLPPSRERLIYSCVDSEVFSPEKRQPEARRGFGVSDDQVFIGLIGRLQRVKGQRYFIKAAALLAREHPQARFLIAGRGSEGHMKALWDYAESVDLPRERLRIEGVLPNLPEVIASLDVGAVASIGSEGSSRVTLEYMASGVPVVATRVGGIPELLTDGKDGWLVPPRDAQALAERLAQLIRDEGLRKAMGMEGRRRALDQFSLPQWVAEVESLYLDTLAAGSRAR